MGLEVAYGYAKVAQKIWTPSLIGNMEIVQYMYTLVAEISKNMLKMTLFYYSDPPLE